MAAVAVSPLGSSALTFAATGSNPAKARAGAANRVGVLTYALGNSALKVPGYEATEGGGLAPIELTAIVHHPSDMSRGKHPLIVLQHGMWSNCLDRKAVEESDRLAAEAEAATDEAEKERLDDASRAALTPIGQWPCAAGTAPLNSFRGYDYLGQSLAEKGFVVVSIGANGVNAGPMGEAADLARAAVGNEHLRLWRDLVNNGTGALKNALRDGGTGRKVTSPFKGHVDLAHVGVLGHSRGGRGVMWQVADKHAGDVPKGVRIAAAVPLAAPGPWDTDDPEVVADYRTTRIPVLVWNGNCDYAAGEDWASVLAPSKAPIHDLLVHGANHNFLNTQWSPSSGLLGAEDDADAGGHPAPGQCVGRRGVPGPQRQLTESEERRVIAGYASAFFGRYLLGEKSSNAVLSGKHKPFREFATVDVSTVRPGERPADSAEEDGLSGQPEPTDSSEPAPADKKSLRDG